MLRFKASIFLDFLFLFRAMILCLISSVSRGDHERAFLFLHPLRVEVWVIFASSCSSQNELQNNRNQSRLQRQIESL